jgi:hypothetical protein
MVAYSFNRRFVDAILLGLEPGPWLPGMKRQTIRGPRNRHARPGEAIQLYTGQRTRCCRKLGVARCMRVRPIVLQFSRFHLYVAIAGRYLERFELESFVRLDGFASRADMLTFWRSQREPKRGEILELADAVLIEWVPRDGEA